MTNVLQPGSNGDRLPSEEYVLRLIKPNSDGGVSETSFTLSTNDEASELKSVSVFAEQLTTPLQALGLVEDVKDDYQLYARLNVSEIRSIRPEPDSEDITNLDVVWDLLQDNDGNADKRPGASGHAGITGLYRLKSISNGKKLYRSLRFKLADLAKRDLHSINEGNLSTTQS